MSKHNVITEGSFFEIFTALVFEQNVLTRICYLTQDFLEETVELSWVVIFLLLLKRMYDFSTLILISS